MKYKINSKSIDHRFNLDDIDQARHFLCNLHIGDARVENITLANGCTVKMEDIPEDQIIQRAKEIREWIVQGKA